MRRVPALILLAASGMLAAPSARAETLEAALADAYNDNPQLQAERANLRATDEGVNQALAGWRPTVQLNAAAGRERFEATPATATPMAWIGGWSARPSSSVRQMPARRATVASGDNPSRGRSRRARARTRPPSPITAAASESVKISTARTAMPFGLAITMGDGRPGTPRRPARSRTRPRAVSSATRSPTVLRFRPV